MSMPAPSRSRSRLPRIAGDAVERARLHVVPRARARAPRMPFVTLVTLVLVGGVVGLLLFNTSLQQSSFAANNLEDQADTLAARQQTLAMELEDLRNPQRVAEEAQRLGMVIAPAPAFLSLDGTVSGERIKASPENRLRIAPPAPQKPAVLDPAPTVVEVPAQEPATDPGATTGATTDPGAATDPAQGEATGAPATAGGSGEGRNGNGR